jgi:putative membrane protein
MKRTKTIILVVLAVLAVIIMLQNTQTMETRILFITISMPRALLLFVTLMVGFGLGILVALTGFKRR